MVECDVETTPGAALKSTAFTFLVLLDLIFFLLLHFCAWVFFYMYVFYMYVLYHVLAWYLHRLRKKV